MKKALATLSIIALAATAAQAQVVYSTNFNAPTYTDGGLIGQDGWAITGTSTVNVINVANTATNGNVTLTTTGQDVNRVWAPAATPANATSIDLSADITVNSASTTADYFLHLGDGGASNFFDRVYVKQGSVSGTFDLGLATSNGTITTFGTDLTIGTPIHIDALYNFVAGAGNDTGELSVNGSPYVAAQTLGTDANSISSVNLRQGSTTPGVTVDNIAVTVTAAAVPEPATWMLMGVGLLAGVTKRFRRRS